MLIGSAPAALVNPFTSMALQLRHRVPETPLAFFLLKQLRAEDYRFPIIVPIATGLAAVAGTPDRPPAFAGGHAEVILRLCFPELNAAQQSQLLRRYI